MIRGVACQRCRKIISQITVTPSSRTSRITPHNPFSDRLLLFVLLRKLLVIMYFRITECLRIIGRANWGKHKDVYSGESGRLKFAGIRDPKRMLDSTPVHSQIVNSSIGAH